MPHDKERMWLLPFGIGVPILEGLDSTTESYLSDRAYADQYALVRFSEIRVKRLGLFGFPLRTHRCKQSRCRQGCQKFLIIHSRNREDYKPRTGEPIHRAMLPLPFEPCICIGTIALSRTGRGTRPGRAVVRQRRWRGRLFQ